MYGELASEVIHCPNCSEDVPKTLYCLNCGYPLYKIEQEQKASEEITREIDEPDVSTEDTDVDMSVEIEPSPEVEIDAIEDELETTIEVDESDIHETEIEEIPEETMTEAEMEYSKETEDSQVEEEMIEEVAEEATESVVTEPIIQEETKEEPPQKVTEPPTYDTPSPVPVTRETVTPDYKGEEHIMEETSIKFAPDPLTKEVMENLAKNITLKIRLVRLLKDGQVKEETFKKLFDSYVEQGRIWISRRDETLKRFKADIQRMEENLVNARKDYELLEIRKSIGDADDKEYEVKAPAYKWDIEHLDKEIQNRKAGISYVSNLKNLVPEEEVDELKQMSSTDYSQIDEIEEVTEEARSRIKESLAEAYNSITTPTSNIF